MITHLAAQVCRDAQQGEHCLRCGAFAERFAPYISLPLIRSLLAIVGAVFDAASYWRSPSAQGGHLPLQMFRSPGWTSGPKLSRRKRVSLSGVSPRNCRRRAYGERPANGGEKVRSSSADIAAREDTFVCACLYRSRIRLISAAGPRRISHLCRCRGDRYGDDLDLARTSRWERRRSRHFRLFPMSFCRCPPPRRPERRERWQQRNGGMYGCASSVARSVLVPCVCGYAALSVARRRCRK